MKKLFCLLTALCMSICLLFSGCEVPGIFPNSSAEQSNGNSSYEAITGTEISFTTARTNLTINIPEYSGQAYIAVNNNQPFFTPSEYVTTSFERYSELDSLGRCGETYASVGKDIMPTEERGEIGSVKPTGWQTAKYDCVSGKYLYNRCHLIGYQLTGENANTKNLITGTRYLNIDGMLPFENLVADYVKETNNHVLYRVTPIFDANNLVAHGVLMEGYSVEDNGDGVCYNVYCYNVQPQICIDYLTGNSYLATEAPNSATTSSVNSSQTNETSSVKSSSVDSSNSLTSANEQNSIVTYVLNTNTKRFHLPSCSSVTSMNQANRADFYGTKEELIEDGYVACGSCKP